MEKFPLCIFGLEFGKREGPEPKTKFRRGGKFSTKVPLLFGMDFRNQGGQDAEKKITIVEYFPPKVEKIPPLQNVPTHVILE